MTRFLLDTNFIVDVLNDRRERFAVLKNLLAEQHELACSHINVTEVYAGMREAESGKTETLLRSLILVPVRFEAAKLAGELRQLWARKGKTLDVPDVIIAAVCITENLTLITDNHKDFPMPELRLHTLK